MSPTATLHARHSRTRPLLWGLVVAAGITALVFALAPEPRSAPAAAGPRSTSPTPVSLGALSSPNAFHDFGSISMAGGHVRHRYALKNVSAAPVTIERIYTSCMCTTATFIRGVRMAGPFGMLGHGTVPPVNQVLAPGESAYVEAVFDPAAHGPAGLGHTEREITIEQSAGRPMRLAFSADVRP